MAAYILKRVLAVVPVVLVVTFLVFLAVHFSPGSPAETLLGHEATPEAVARLEHEMGLNRPLLSQYVHWLGDLLQGKLGDSLVMRVPVSPILFERFQNTVILTAGSLLVCLAFGIGIGIAAGLKPSSWFDRTVMFLATIGSNVPTFWLGIVLMWLFSLKLGWLPSSGMYDLREGETFAGLMKHLILPSLAIAISSLAIVARLIRASVIEVMNADFVQTLRSHGMPHGRIVGKHVLRNVLAPIANITGLEVGYLLGGVLFVETVFSWPGIGSLLYNSIMGHDIPFVQAGVLLIAFTYVLVNLLTDIAVALLNPRFKA
ncbi:ABC transporter permease [Cohnella massiliensis]|uniref:ABC transporter permease n=1 Tax=Cohnella massiliensis TaxID=1816691 RepID=UPI0009BA2543|nr:ABC transporter permease [Cohnella massiliensis]